MTMRPLVCTLAVLAPSLLAQANPTLAQSPLAVEIVTAETGSSSIELDLTGTIEAKSSVPVSFKSAGRLIAVNADIGDTVAAGDVLAQIEAVQAEAARRSAMAQLTAAMANLTQAELARDRAVDLLARGVGTQAEVDAAEAGLLAAQSSHEQAQSGVNKAQQAVDDTTISAPVAGVVTARAGEPGQIAGAGQAVITIAPQGEREAVFYAPNVPQLDGALGRSLSVVPIDGGAAVPVTVTEISPLANVTTGTVRVLARIENGAEMLGLGEPITSRISIPGGETISLPWSVLATQDGQPAVWVVDPASHAVSLTPVSVARFTSQTVEISEGLEAGALVVAAGSNQLYPGRVVAISETTETEGAE